jgi:preprotein translocase subunit YajC
MKPRYNLALLFTGFFVGFAAVFIFLKWRDAQRQQKVRASRVPPVIPPAPRLPPRIC